MSSALRKTVTAAARLSGLYRLLRALHRKQLTIVTYHSVVDVDEATRRRYDPLYRMSVSAAQFEAHVRHFARHYQVIDGDGLAAALSGAPLPPRAAIISFDDGLRNNATVAAPILARHGVPAFFFLATGFVDAASAGETRLHWSESTTARLLTRSNSDDRPLREIFPELAADPDQGRVIAVLKSLSAEARRERLSKLDQWLGSAVDLTRFPADRDGNSVLASMTWDQAAQLPHSGIEIGSHTVNHAILTRLEAGEAERELTESVARIQEKLGQCRFFAYPNGERGDFDETHQTVLARLGCLAAFSQIAGFNQNLDQPYCLRRFNVPADCDLDLLQFRATGLFQLVRGNP
jgi:peptidoglycan/xylan/chitin deacetylase (PgdA/CDA1 family)